MTNATAAPQVTNQPEPSPTPAGRNGSSTTPPRTTTASSKEPKSAPDTGIKSVHFTLQGKGGVGKSVVSSLLTQFLRANNHPVIAIDTDPVNATLVGYKALDAEHIRMMDAESKVDERKFDQLMEIVLGKDTNIVVDNGASTFIPLMSYLVENEAIDMIAAAGKRVVVHSVVTGGQALHDTLSGLKTLGRELPESARLVVWLNEFFGDIRADDKEFEQFKVYQELKERIHGIIRIYRQTSATFGTDMATMLERKLTFAEVAQGTEFSLMAKQRLSRVEKNLYAQIRAVL